MARLDEHPTVVRHRARAERAEAGPLDAAWLRRLCLEAGADDVGFVSIDRAEVADQRAEILAAFPGTRALISIACRLHPEPIRSPARSVSNQEFHANYEHLNDVARRIVRGLADAGVPALNPSSAFPMEMDRYPGKIWVVSHKPIAVAAGLGQVGVHRCVIHPVFGSFINLGTILVARDVSSQAAPVDFNPCLSCKLCVAACPVGAIGADGHFNFSACVTHNYREFMSGFTDWVSTIADSKDGRDYRRRVPASESASMWQSLSFKANYKAAYCVAVCPAGEDVIGPFLDDRGKFLKDVVDPLTAKEEPIYVVPGSDAESHVARRFPRKTIRRVRGVTATSVRGFLFGMRLTFQREASRGLSAVYHFTFTGREPAEATVTIRDRAIRVEDGLIGEPDFRVVADGDAWLGVLAGDRSLIWSILRRRIRARGPLRLLAAFRRCFPR
ncbi:Epoxyqueuosine reductase [Aquisphaera giovannonii]|uniref:Epoxyqueuosine reductase n=1 Tax=Aquisphaera giovannonii TaxID=406548 RepID=A0A5B9W9D3_9BACT|nr:4Fe-4S binding protein [Aquisphaera giovannonii]QEH37163.1 Epoxyqueuosine reductase [Aquisphaera giovannonii]